MTRQSSIAIVGAGIGGLAAAALLADAHRVTLYDQFPEPRPIGSGLVIQPVGQAVLDLCGAGQEARALAVVALVVDDALVTDHVEAAVGELALFFQGLGARGLAAAVEPGFGQ